MLGAKRFTCNKNTRRLRTKKRVGLGLAARSVLFFVRKRRVLHVELPIRIRSIKTTKPPNGGKGDKEQRGVLMVPEAENVGGLV